MSAVDALPAVYLRVSTQRQGQSGLGLEAQRKAIERLLDGQAYEEFIEVESGKKTKRPKLDAAIAYCNKHKTKLVIAKLDRLARNVHFISGLMESGIDFVAADMPSADRFMLHIYAAMAEEEGRRISERTKAALAAAKERGVELGKNGKVLARKRQGDALLFAKAIEAQFHFLDISRNMSLRCITEILNASDLKTYEGGDWYPSTVWRLFQRLKNDSTEIDN